MTLELTRYTDLMMAGIVFGLVLSLWLLGMLLWYRQRAARAEKVERRLGTAPPKYKEAGRVLRLWHEGEEATTTVPGKPWRAALRERLVRPFEEAGWPLDTGQIVFGALGIATLLFLATFALTWSVLAGAGVTVALLIVFWIYLKHRAGRRATRFESQFMDALQVASRSLRAGHPLIGSFRLIAEDVPPPVGELFTQVCQQQSLGMPLADAIREAAERSTSPDMRLFAALVAIQTHSGGNLADMMDRLASVIRGRIALNRRARVLVAQTQLSKRVLLALPFVLFAVLNLINPNYMEPLYTSTMGKVLLGVAALSLALGALVMNRLVVLRH